MATQRFEINFPQSDINDLVARLERTRWSKYLQGSDWERGTEQKALEEIVTYWKESFDWRHQELLLNQFSHYYSQIENVKIHFIHEKGKGPSPIPIVLTHGWPDSFVRYQKVIQMLADPERFGGDPQDAFDVIVPSLPGFCLSDGPLPEGINNSVVAGLWHQLMTKELGYTRYGAGGGDIGSGVSRYIAMQHPESVIGIHVTDIGIVRSLLTADEKSLSEEERKYCIAVQEWIKTEGAYMQLQATKPRTLAWALNDSPLGLASWILEKFMSWGDCNGRLCNNFSYDELLTNITLYWLTGTAGSAANIYYENMHGLSPVDTARVPVGMAQFAGDMLPPPRNWAEKNMNIIHWDNIPRGGHFTALENPEMFIESVRAFYRKLR